MKLIFTFFLLFNSFIHYSQEINTCEGTEFCVGYMHNYNYIDNPITYQTLKINSRFDTNIDITIPNINWSLTVFISADSTIEVIVPFAETTTFFTIGENGVFVNSSKPISLTAMNWAMQSSDATKIFPTSYLGDEYYTISSKTVKYGINPSKSEFLIVATEDYTKIHIGDNLTIDLNKGQTYQYKSNEISGVKIFGDSLNGNCKPFALFCGAQSTATPVGCSAAMDHTYEQTLPTKHLGFKHFVAPINLVNSFEIKIVATSNNTEIEIDNILVTTLNEGDAYTYSTGVNQVIESNKLISVQQDLKSGGCSGTGWGDPATSVILSENKTINFSSFNNFESTLIDTAFFNIITKSSFINSIYFNDTLINPNIFIPFEGDSTMSYAIIPITHDNNVLQTINNFQAYTYGLSNGNWESYFYNFGWYEEKQVKIDSSICFTGDSLLLSNPNLSQTGWWTENENVLVQNDTLILSTPVNSSTYTYNYIDDYSGCLESNNINIININDTNTIQINSNHENLCAGTNIQLNLVGNVNFNQYSVEWQPAYLFNNNQIFNPDAHIEESLWIYASLRSLGGCDTIMDSLYLNVNNSNNTVLYNLDHTQKKYCNDSTTLNLNTYSILAKDNFNDSINSTIWETWTGTETTDLCSSIELKSLQFNGNIQREIETYAMDLSLGGKVNFYSKSSNGTDCDSTEYGDDLFIEYSIDNGLTWQTLYVLYQSLHHNMNYNEIELPQLAQTTSTKIRFKQYNFEGLELDTWIIDNLKIYVNSTPIVTWFPTTNMDYSNIMHPKVLPTLNTWYKFTIINGNCLLTDSIFIESSHQNIAINHNTIGCNDDSVNLHIENLESQNTSQYYWYQLSNNQEIFMGSDSVLALQGTPYEQVIFFSINPNVGCTVTDSLIIPPMSTSKIQGDNTICFEDSIHLYHENIKYYLENFNDTIYTNNLWDTIINPQLSQLYGSQTGTAFILDNNSLVETINLNTLQTDTISFFLGIGNSLYGNNTLSTYNVKLQASVDDGVTWVNIFSSYTQPTAANYIKVYINELYRTSATKFKWSNTGGPIAIDNIVIPVINNSVNYEWQYPKDSLIGTNQTLSYTIDSSDYVYLSVYDSLASCIYIDSIFIKVGSSFETNLNDIVACSFLDTLDVSINVDTLENYTFNWKYQQNTYTPSFVTSTESSIGVFINEEYKTVYSAVESINGCTMYDTISVYSPFSYYNINFLGNSEVCNGEEVNLTAGLTIQQYTSPTINNSLSSGFSNGYLCTPPPPSISTTQIKTFVSANLRSFVLNPSTFTSLEINLIEYYFSYGSGNFSCDTPELGEEVILQKSDNNGITWQSLDTIPIANNLHIKKMYYEFPNGSHLGNSMLRWIQPSNSGANEDVWSIAKVEFLENISSSDLNYTWSSVAFPTNSTSDTISFDLTSPITITLEITDTNGCSISDSLTINSDNTFTVNAGVDTTLCTTGNYFLNGTTNATNTYMLWTDSQNNFMVPLATNSAAHVNSEGSHELILSVNSEGCIKQDTVIITIVDAGNSNITYDSLLCVGDSLFIDLDDSFSSIIWLPNDNILNQGFNNYSIITDSTVVYSLIYNDQYGCQYSDSLELILSDPYSMNIQNDTSICPLDQIVISPYLSSNTNGLTYLWSTGEQTPTITTNQPGTYWLETTNSCNIKSDTITISIIPDINLELPSDTSICILESILIQPTSNNSNINYLWNTGEQTPTITTDQPGIYWLETSNSCYIETDSIIISNTPNINVELPNDTSICISESILITPTTNNPNINYLWNTGEQTPTITTNQPGTYWLVATNSCYTTNDTINISNIPNINLELPNDTSICISESILIMPTSNNPNINYLWNTGEQTTTITTDLPGIYWLETTNNCQIASDTIIISTYTAPNTTITNNITSLTSNENNAASYTWFNCNNSTNVLNETNQSLTLTENGVYSVIIENQFGCIDTSECETIDYLEIFNNEINLTVYPNPTNQYINIKFSQNNAITQLLIKDKSGKNIINLKEVDSGSKINLESLSSGVYIILITDISGNLNRFKVVKL